MIAGTLNLTRCHLCDLEVADLDASFQCSHFGLQSKVVHSPLAHSVVPACQAHLAYRAFVWAFEMFLLQRFPPSEIKNSYPYGFIRGNAVAYDL